MNTATAAAPMPPFFAALLLLLPLVLIAIIMPLTVRSRRGIVFGVTLPLDFADSDEVREAISRFRRNNTRIAATAIMLVVWLHAKHYVNAAVSASVLGTFGLLIGGLVLRAREAARLKPHAIVVPLTRTASLTATNQGNGPLVASLLAFLPLLAAGLWLREHWAAIPARCIRASAR